MKRRCPVLLLIVIFMLLAGCSQSPSYEHLKDVKIVIDGDPSEWEPFPIVHEDPEDDNISIEIDISNIKAFTNLNTGYMYLLVESFIPVKEFTTLELDLKYGEEYYRVGFIPGEDRPATLAKENDEGEFELVDYLYGTNIASGQSVEISFPVTNFPDTDKLHIANLRVMGGICCNQFEYYAVDYITIKKPTP